MIQKYHQYIADFLFRAFNNVWLYLPTDTAAKSVIVIIVVNQFGIT